MRAPSFTIAAQAQQRLEAAQRGYALANRKSRPRPNNAFRRGLIAGMLLNTAMLGAVIGTIFIIKPAMQEASIERYQQLDPGMR